MPGEFTVVLADVVDSQQIEERGAFEERLSAAIETVNDRHRESIHTAFSTIKGIDEFGGVLTSIAPVADIQRTFSRMLHPEQFRMAVVNGQIDVNEDSGEISQMDGPAFARGDELLEELAASGFSFRLEGGAEHVDDLVSDEINLLEIIRGEWRETTVDVVAAYERAESQEVVAERLGVTPQTVSYHLGKPNVGLVLEIEQRLSAILEHYGEIHP